MVRSIVIGAGGYTGAELIATLHRHPYVDVAGIYRSPRHGDEEEAFSDLFPRFRGRIDTSVQPTSIDRITELNAEVAFLATPHEASHDLVPELVDRGLTVFDLSGAYRLRSPAPYPAHYGFEHEHPELLKTAVYGIPEIARRALRGAPSLIAVAGCYPTSAILPLHPLVQADAADTTSRPIVDSVSGVSGAGRSPSLKTHFCEVSLQPYNVLSHRHNPEIDIHAGVEVVFTPHLAPFDRGLLSTIHVELHPGWDEPRVRGVFEEAYGGETFIRLLSPGQWPSVADCRGTNYCDIGLAVDETHDHLVLVSAIDNLVKGAAGQAVQCFNAVFGYPEETGLGSVTP